MTRGKYKKGNRFVAFPVYLLETREYVSLTHAARSLLLCIAAQYTGHNNGRLVATSASLARYGWRSRDSISGGIGQLMTAGLLTQTRIGMRPNRAAWYALGWRDLDQRDGIEIDPSLFRKFIGTPLSPLSGLEKAPIGPLSGLEKAPPSPKTGRIRPKKTRALVRSPDTSIDIAIYSDN
jgi:hypothetical protein